MELIIRPETPEDHRAVEELTRSAFWNQYVPGCDEHYLVHIMRPHPDFCTELNFVAEADGNVIGNIMFTRSHLLAPDGERLETVTFGPVSVHPEYQRKGIGTALIRHTTALVRSQGSPAVIIFGNPSNYVSLGFVGAKHYGISTPEGTYPAAMLVLPLQHDILAAKQWKFHESDVFTFDRTLVDAFDAQFPPLEKQHRPSQELFAILSRSFVQ